MEQAWQGMSLMNTAKAEQLVAELLREQASLRRFRLALSPDKQLLLDRLLVRLGWSTTSMIPTRLQRKSILVCYSHKDHNLSNPINVVFDNSESELTGNGETVFDNLFPSSTPEQVARAAGAIDGTKTIFQPVDLGDGVGMYIMNEHPDINTFRLVYRDNYGHLIMENLSQLTSNTIRGKGYKRFAETLKHARDVGIRIFKADGAGRGNGTLTVLPDDYNGYYTWPRYGFDGELDTAHLETLRNKNPELYDLLDGHYTYHNLFDTKGGDEYWKRHGFHANELIFDTDPNSPHSQRFNKYYNDREQRNANTRSETPVVEGSGVSSLSETPQKTNLQRKTTSGGIKENIRMERELRKYSKLTLGESRPFKGPMGENMTEHDYHDESGNKMGVIRLQPRNDGEMLHIHWIGPTDVKAGEVSHTVGSEGIRSLIPQLKSLYPSAQFISGVRAGGFRKGEMKGERVVKQLARKKVVFPSKEYPAIVRHLAVALDNPLDNNALIPLADHLVDLHEDDPIVHEFVKWVTGDNDAWKRMVDAMKDTEHHARTSDNGRAFMLTDKSVNRKTREGISLHPQFHRFYHHKKWSPVVFNPVHLTRDFVNIAGQERTIPTIDVADTIYRIGGARNAIHAVIGARMFHPRRIGGQFVPGTNSEKDIKFRRRKYAKVDSHEPAHPLVAGFPIEHALRHLANDPKNNDNIRNLALLALTGKNRLTGEVKPEGMPEALWMLNDALQEHTDENGNPAEHPLAKAYNWMSAADKVLKDQKVYEALRRTSEDSIRLNNYSRESWAATPEATSVRVMANVDVPHPEVNNFFRHLKSVAPDIDEATARESLLRHLHRANQEFRNIHIINNKESITESLLPREKLRTKEGKATRYAKQRTVHYAKTRSDFIDALRRIRSSNQKSLHKIAQQIAKKLGLDPSKIIDALHDSPALSVPGIAQAVYGNASPEQIHSAASWIGLTANLPGVAVFHLRDSGPDTLYRFRQFGSGLDIRNKLNKFGIKERVLIPHREGFDIVIPDKGSRNSQLIGSYLQQNKLQTEISRGHFHEIGSAIQADARNQYRNIISKQEHNNKGVQFSRRRPVRYSKQLVDTYNQEFKKLVSEHARNTPHGQAFYNANHFQEILGATKGDKDKAADVATELLYRDKHKAYDPESNQHPVERFRSLAYRLAQPPRMREQQFTESETKSGNKVQFDPSENRRIEHRISDEEADEKGLPVINPNETPQEARQRGAKIGGQRLSILMQNPTYRESVVNNIKKGTAKALIKLHNSISNSLRSGKLFSDVAKEHKVGMKKIKTVIKQLINNNHIDGVHPDNLQSLKDEYFGLDPRDYLSLRDKNPYKLDIQDLVNEYGISVGRADMLKRHITKRYRNNLLERGKKGTAVSRDRMKNDPELRNKVLESGRLNREKHRERFFNDPEYRQKTIEKAKQSYSPEKRKNTLKIAAEARRKNLENNPERQEKMKKVEGLLRQGVPFTKISEQTGVTDRTIKRWFPNHAELSSRKPKFTSDFANKVGIVKGMRQAGLSPLEIAKKTGLNIHNIKTWLSGVIKAVKDIQPIPYKPTE